MPGASQEGRTAMTGKLIVPLDGSPLGESVLPWASCLAKSAGYSVLLAHIVPWRVLMPSHEEAAHFSAQALERRRAAEYRGSEHYLERHKAELAAQGLEVETVVCEGEPAEAIERLVEEQQASMIAMATHGRGGLTRLLLGSVAERMLGQATVPMLLVHGRENQAQPAPSLERILVPLDGSMLAERALTVALDVAPESTLVLTRVTHAAIRDIGLGDGILEVPDSQGTQHHVEEAEQYLEGTALANLGVRAKLQIAVRIGEPAEQILQAARDEQATLIVMGTHGRTAPARIFMGSVADEVFRHADQPVLLVSARARVAGQAPAANQPTHA
jgi:nucleotide-binding universal stress UspA family protein